MDDRHIHGWLRRGLHGARALCYLVILYAFTGYYAVMAELYDVSPVVGAAACDRLHELWSVLVTPDRYVPLSADNCAALGDGAQQIGSFSIMSTPEALEHSRRLAWTDVINAGAWILVVVMLEVEVRLQLRRDLSASIMHGLRFFKVGIYGVLFLCALYWGWKGNFLDFWDAVLWLFAFIFIELNVFDWQKETSQTAQADVST